MSFDKLKGLLYGILGADIYTLHEYEQTYKIQDLNQLCSYIPQFIYNSIIKPDRVSDTESWPYSRNRLNQRYPSPRATPSDTYVITNLTTYDEVNNEILLQVLPMLITNQSWQEIEAILPDNVAVKKIIERLILIFQHFLYNSDKELPKELLEPIKEIPLDTNEKIKGESLYDTWYAIQSVLKNNISFNQMWVLLKRDTEEKSDYRYNQPIQNLHYNAIFLGALIGARDGYTKLSDDFLFKQLVKVIENYQTYDKKHDFWPNIENFDLNRINKRQQFHYNIHQYIEEYKINKWWWDLDKHLSVEDTEFKDLDLQHLMYFEEQILTFGISDRSNFTNLIAKALDKICGVYPFKWFDLLFKTAQQNPILQKMLDMSMQPNFSQYESSIVIGNLINNDIYLYRYPHLYYQIEADKQRYEKDILENLQDYLYDLYDGDIKEIYQPFLDFINVKDLYLSSYHNDNYSLKMDLAGHSTNYTNVITYYDEIEENDSEIGRDKFRAFYFPASEEVKQLEAEYPEINISKTYNQAMDGAVSNEYLPLARLYISHLTLEEINQNGFEALYYSRIIFLDLLRQYGYQPTFEEISNTVKDTEDEDLYLYLLQHIKFTTNQIKQLLEYPSFKPVYRRFQCYQRAVGRTISQHTDLLLDVSKIISQYL